MYYYVYKSYIPTLTSGSVVVGAPPPCTTATGSRSHRAGGRAGGRCQAARFRFSEDEKKKHPPVYVLTSV